MLSKNLSLLGGLYECLSGPGSYGHNAIQCAAGEVVA